MKIKLFLLYLITLLVYTQGFLERFTPFPAELAIEIGVLALMLFSFRPKVGLLWMVVIGVVGVFASMLSSSGLASFMKYFRYFFYFYVVFTALWNMQFTIVEFNRYVRFIVMMVLLQGVASVINLAFFGMIEYNVGAMSSMGGTTATAFPLFIFSVLLVVFYFSKFDKKKWYVYILLMIASVFLMAYGSGKRAIFFYVPAFLVGISMICTFLLRKGKLNRKILWIISVIVLFAPVYFIGITQVGGISNQMSGDENRMEVLTKAFDYAQEYEDAESNGGTMGRSNTTEVILYQAIQSREGWFAGHGFSAVKDDNEKSLSGVIYGIVGYTRDVFSGGLVFASLVALFFVFLIFYRDTKQQDKFSKAMRIVILIVFIVIHFTYSSDFTVRLKMNMILAPILCFLNSSNYIHLKEYYRQYLIYE